MRFLSVRDLTRSSARVWKTLSTERDMVVTQNGHPIAILCAVTEDQIDESLAAIRRAKATIAVAQLQSRAAEHSLSQLAAEQIDLEIRQSRSQRRLTPGS